MGLWLKWEKQFMQAKEPNLQQIHQRILSEIQEGITQESCNSLASLLNQTINNNMFDEFGPQLLQKVVEASNISEAELGDISFATNKKGGRMGLKITSTATQNAWSEFRKYASSLTKEEKELEKNMDDSKYKQLMTYAQSLEGKLNHIRGQILESFLKAAKNTFIDMSTDIAANSTNELLDNFIKGLPKTLRATTSDDLTHTQGSQSQNVEVVIGEQYIKTISSQGKVDETLPSPFLDQQILNISAKNYTRISNINILAGGSLLGLLSQGMSQKENKYVYNAFTIPSSNWVSVNVNQLKKIFATQALIGQKKNETKADVLVLSFNNRKNPITVISISSLLKEICKSNNIDFAFTFNPEILSAVPLGNGTARQETIFSKVADLKMNVTLNKTVLSAKYISNLI